VPVDQPHARRPLAIQRDICSEMNAPPMPQIKQNVANAPDVQPARTHTARRRERSGDRQRQDDREVRDDEEEMRWPIVEILPRLFNAQEGRQLQRVVARAASAVPSASYRA